MLNVEITNQDKEYKWRKKKFLILLQRNYGVRLDKKTLRAIEREDFNLVA